MALLGPYCRINVLIVNKFSSDFPFSPRMLQVSAFIRWVQDYISIAFACFEHCLFLCLDLPSVRFPGLAPPLASEGTKKLHVRRKKQRVGATVQDLCSKIAFGQINAHGPSFINLSRGGTISPVLLFRKMPPLTFRYYNIAYPHE